MTIYLAEYSACIYESDFRTLSIHKSPESAQKAIDYHKLERLKWWNEVYEHDEDKESEVKSAMDMEDWKVTTMELLD